MRIVLLLLLFLVWGCDSKIEYIELKMPNKNPTSYKFSAPLNSVKEAIIKNQKKMPLLHMTSANDSSIASWGKQTLIKPENKDDFFLYNMITVDTSIIYYSPEGKIPYDYSIHIHLSIIDFNNTLVEINTIDPEICIGVRFPYNILPFSEPGASYMKSVPPSTIEEYKVLLVIGEGLGVRDQMPPLILPDTRNKE